MSSETYAIVFKGEIVDGFKAEVVKAQLSKLLKADEKKTAALFSGKQIVLKKTTDREEAAKYGKALKKVGADVKIKVIKAEPAPSGDALPPVFQKAEPPAFQKADAPDIQSAETAKPKSIETPVAKSAVPDTSGLSLRANEGNLFDPAPESDKPDIDVSGISVAENDDSPLAKPADEVIVDIDLSEYSIKENDGSPLVEAAQKAVPKVQAPDFGLDEPGAVLETLKEEKELLNPNTMGMSLAMTGADLLEEDEKPPAPPPRAPDTSKINLVPNFDR